MTLGRLENQYGEDNSEVEFYKTLLRKNPQKHHLLDFLAYALFKQAEYIEAIHCWKKLLRKEVIKEEFRILAKIAHAYELLGELEHSYHYFRLANEVNPKNLEIIGKYGEVAYLIENYDDSINAFKILTKKEPFNEIAWHNLGLSYYNIGRHEQAIKCLERSLELVDDEAETWYTLATIYSENYQVEQALIALDKALTIDKELIDRAKSDESFYSLIDSSLFRYFIYG